MEMQRSFAIDALRGAAILMMVFSGVQPHGGAFPAWMYHAQVPPPDHIFNPNLPGITWVDLVFPFFLFSMGAAIPFALPLRVTRDGATGAFQGVVRRFALLLVFAIVSFNFAPLRIPETGQWAGILGIFAYLGLFMALVQYPGLKQPTQWAFRISGWGLLAGLSAVLLFRFQAFDPAKNDPIIRVLANVYLAGAGIWWLTRKNLVLRAGFFLLILAFYLGSLEQSSWVAPLWNSHGPWNLVSPMLLKYLLIFLPGTLAGDWLAEKNAEIPEKWPVPTLVAAITGIVLWALFSRNVGMGFALVLLLIGILYLVQRQSAPAVRICLAGAMLLAIGFFIEPFQGGIKKDHATLSYFFITSGLAYLWISAFSIRERSFWHKILRPLALLGNNALLAYLMAGFVLAPLFEIAGIASLIGNGIVGGLLKAIAITALMTWISAKLAAIKVFWKV
jgi:predicted acyltransferase